MRMMQANLNMEDYMDACVKAATLDDALVFRVFKETGTKLGEACANLAAVLSPEAFMFFGGLASAGDVLMEPVRKAYDENVLSLYRGKAQILQSGLADANAAILGASALGWEVDKQPLFDDWGMLMYAVPLGGLKRVLYILMTDASTYILCNNKNT